MSNAFRGLNRWHSDSSITPIELFDRIKLYFKDCETISQWIERAEFLKEKLMAIIRGEELLENRLKDINQMQPACWLKKFSFYSISEDEVNYFIRILKEIELLAEEIFGSSKGGRIDFVKHFERLIQQIRIKMQRNKSIEREQVELVEEIFQRLNRPLYDEILGTVEDLKEALHFYLDKKQNPDNSANWIVRDFEQIDGGVLLSERTDNKIYHYALLSDRNMKGRQRDFLPWPITMEMLSGYKDRCRELAVFLCAAGEYKNFLRFSLFYGAYFLLSDLELSYVENSEGEREAPYFALEMLGLKKDYQSGCFDYDVQRALDQKKPERDCELDFSNEEVETFSICPYRFVLDTIEGDRYYYQSEFQCRYYYIVFLTLLVRKLSAGETKEQVRQCFEKKAELLRKYFPFWSNIDFRDIEQKVWKDLMDQLNRADRMRPIGNPDKYPRRKNRFLFAKYVENGENLMQFSCTEDTKNNLEKYLLDNRVDEFNNKNIEGFCDYCCKREVCLNQYIER